MLKFFARPLQTCSQTADELARKHLNKFLNPETDGVVLPILNLNGYKIANPAVLAHLT